ncbi:MAG: IucA/IucC family protein [Terriglobales bacterium]
MILIPPPSACQELSTWAKCHAPNLTPEIPEAVRDAERIVARSLAAALRREGLAAPGLAVAFEADVGFERALVSDVTSFGATIDTTGQLLQSQACLEGATDYQRDIANAVLHLALTLLRQRAAAHGNFDDPKLLERCRRLDPVSANLALDRTNALGHNVHPLSRLRRGFDPCDAVRYAAECLPDRQVALRFAAVRIGLLQRTPSAEAGPGRHLDQILMAEFPSLAAAFRNLPRASEHSLVPMHPWQFDHVLTRSYRRELDSGDIIALDAQLPTTPTTSLRTLICEPGVSGSRWAVKTAINVRLTSTRRDISVATTTDSPMISRTVGRIVAGDRWLAERVGVITEVAGAAFRASTDETDAARIRGLSAVLREDFSPSWVREKWLSADPR